MQTHTEQPETTMQLQPMTDSSPLPTDYTRIRQRLLDLLDILETAFSLHPMDLKLKLMMNGSMLILRKGIAQENPMKLHLLVSSLSGMLKAVSALGSSPQEYEDKVEPHINKLAELFTAK